MSLVARENATKVTWENHSSGQMFTYKTAAITCDFTVIAGCKTSN